MKIRFWIIMTLLVLCAQYAVSQAVLVFDEQRHNFGSIQEQLGPVTHNFQFRNTGNEPLIISRIRTSCGCTIPEYSEEPIAPGDSGSIKITFNPAGRPGEFSKAIYVYANTVPDRTILRIIGKVEQESTIADMQFAYRIGDIALKSLHFSLSKIVKGTVVEDSMVVVNVGDNTITPRAEHVPAHMAVTFHPDTLQKGESGIMHIAYDADAIDDWGYRRDEFNIEGTVTSDTPSDDVRYNTITVSGILQEDFDSYTAEQRENAPILVVGRPNVDFKVVEGTKKVRREIYVFNAGNTPLTIHKVRTDGDVITASMKKKSIKPGQSTVMIIELDPMRARSNTLLSDLFIVSNDPTNPSQSIRITAELR